MRAHADVVVVGGGILGCGIAAELARGGADVVLVERTRIAAGASGRNHGLLVRPEHAGVQPLARASLDAYRELGAVTPLDLALDAEPVGLVIVVTEESRWADAEREAAGLARSGCAVERLDGAALREVEPCLSHGCLGGFLVDDGYRVDPAVLTLALAYRARASGAEVCTYTDVKQVLAAGGKVRGVATDRGVVEAPTVVDAAGPWAARVARTASPDLPGPPIGGVRGWLLLVEAQPGLVRHIVVSAGWHLPAGDPGPGPGAVTVGDYGNGTGTRRDLGTLVQQNRDGRVLLGGSRTPSLAEDPEGADATGEIARRAAAVVPALARAAIAGVWSGVRPTSPDGVPLIGWVPGIEGLFVAGGHGGHGVTLGAGSARLAAQMLLGIEPFTDPAPYDPGRFAPAAATPASR